MESIDNTPKAPTPFLRAFPSKKVLVTTDEFLYRPDGRIKEKVVHGVMVEYRGVCPWNPDIDLLSDECAKCPDNKRLHVDHRYPACSVVCQRLLDNVPVPAHLHKITKELIDKRVAENTPAAYERYKEINNMRITTRTKKRKKSTKPKTKVKKNAKP